MARNINHAFSPWMTSECTVESQFQKLHGRIESLEDKQGHGLDSVINNGKLKGKLKLIHVSYSNSLLLNLEYVLKLSSTS